MAARQVAVGLTRVAQAALGVGLVGFVGQECLYNVDGGERAVIFNRFRGVEPKTIGEGTHLRIPMIDYPNIFDIRSKPRIINTTTGTKDLQMVNIALRVLSRPDEAMLPKIFQDIGKDFDERVLPSIGNEVLKAVVAQYNADQLLTMREKVSAQINDTLTQRAKNFHLILDDVSITHLTFGKDFTIAVEAKQVALQDAERSKFVVMKAEQEKKVSVIEAEGEAEAAQLISAALQKSGRGLIEVRRIDASKDIAETLAKSRNVTYLPSGKGGNNMLLNIGVGQ
uniref:Prohibitin n=2 Tax=Aplanochytrium stocchinoi TaxID=215587 RepID=A0A7S3LRB7_9STRA|mmetsp:Transcript_17712/g.21827  ORF Transcript_17712/g.21827 Transcript_17712/m.21827 type:complete len:282 (-) Transcript_17712:325-1170(-)